MIHERLEQRLAEIPCLVRAPITHQRLEALTLYQRLEALVFIGLAEDVLKRQMAIANVRGAKSISAQNVPFGVPPAHEARSILFVKYAMGEMKTCRWEGQTIIFGVAWIVGQSSKRTISITERLAEHGKCFYWH